MTPATPRVQVLLATANVGKIAELRRILASDRIELLGLHDVAGFTPGPEIGATFAANALAKAREAALASGLPALADDSGLAVDALNGMPGVLSARWAGRHGADQENVALLLAQVRDVPVSRRGAQFVCAAAFWLPDGRSATVQGVMAGQLATAPRGAHGFGYDPILVPDGLSVTAAELSAKDKDAISHRGQAFRALAPLFTAALAQRT